LAEHAAQGVLQAVDVVACVRIAREHDAVLHLIPQVGQYVAEGLEHHPDSSPGYDSELHGANMEKRARKVRLAGQEVETLKLYERFGDADARIGILGWGSTIGPVMEAVERAQAEGIKVAVLYIKMVYPLHRALIEEFIAKREAIIVPELNYVGQLARMIQAEFWREVISLRKFGGTPFKTREVYEEIKRVHGELKKSTKKPVAKKAIAKKVASKKKARR